MSTTRQNEIAFVDTKLENYQSLIDGLNPGTEVILISGGNGLQQMGDALVGRSGLDAIHIFSHGSAESLQLGDTLLTGANLNSYASRLTQIGQSLTGEGDLLLYGCNVGTGETGQAFVESVARIMQADVAASDDLTGNAALGGDWVLEAASGSVESSALISNAYTQLLGGEPAVNPVPVLVKDINPGTSHSGPSYLTNVNGTLYFTASDGTNGAELWKSDGTADGTVMVKNISPITSSFPGYLTNVNGTLYFQAVDGTNGVELWKSDGTADGTVLVKNIAATGGVSSNPANLTNVGNTLYFSANNSSTNNNYELWKSDGTLGGTVVVKDITAAPGGSIPANLTDVNGTLYFTARDTTNGTELWKSDGTLAGTVVVKDISPGAGVYSSYPEYLTAVGTTLYFKATDGTNGYELWKSDGTAAGTMMVKNIHSA